MRLVALLALVSCAQPDFVTSQGLEVYDETGSVSAGGIDVAAGAIIRVRGASAAALEGVRVRVVAGSSFVVDGTEYMGTYDSDARLITFVAEPCVGDSMLPHELTHAIRHAVEDGADGSHDDPGYWSVPTGVWFRAAVETKMALCPE